MTWISGVWGIWSAGQSDSYGYWLTFDRHFESDEDEGHRVEAGKE
jgi:hypothetical protein